MLPHYPPSALRSCGGPTLTTNNRLRVVSAAALCAALRRRRMLARCGLAVSRVMQVWRDIIVRNRLLEDEASSPYLQRKHLVLKDTGYACAAAACARVQRAEGHPCFSAGEDEGGA